MKKIFFFSIFAFVFFATPANSILIILQKTGGKVSYSFEEEPKITMAGDSFVLTTNKTAVIYPILDVENFTFEESSDPIEALEQENVSETTWIYNLEGKLVKTLSQADGVNTCSFTDLPSGTYIVKNDRVSYKIIKK